MKKLAIRREHRINETQAESAIKDYVDHVADIAKFPDATGGTPDFDTPLGDTLPASIDPETAAGLASNLRAALPRIRELLGCSPGAARKTAKPTHPALGASPRETAAVFDRTAANLRHGKGGKQRVVPITDTVDDDEIRAAMTAAVAG
jgi:hypothetical protein